MKNKKRRLKTSELVALGQMTEGWTWFTWFQAVLWLKIWRKKWMKQD